MDDKRDPVARGLDGSVDLYGISTWEERTRLDWFASRVYGGISILARVFVILIAALILLLQFVFGGLAVVGNHPWVGVFVFLSVVPAFALAAYIWYADVTMSEPLPLLVGTFCLGVLLAMFAAVFNTTMKPISGIPVVGGIIYFYLIVGPTEETVKLLAVRLFAYRSDKFDAVIDGAVYGAMAGLGFATIENAIYISHSLLTSPSTDPILNAGHIAVFRLFAGPGHVIYSAFAGYYLGLAKFNREKAGPIIVKGLLIAAFIHATYNTLVGFVPDLITTFYPGITPGIGYIAFVFIYDGFFGYLLYRKISRYRSMYSRAERMGGMDDDYDETRPMEFDSQSELRDRSGRTNDSQREAKSQTSANGGTESGLLGNEGGGVLENETVYANGGEETNENENRGESTDENDASDSEF